MRCGTALCWCEVQRQEAGPQRRSSALIRTRSAFKIVFKILLVFLKTGETGNVLQQLQLHILCLVFSLLSRQGFCIAKCFSDFFIPCPVIENRFKYHSDLLSSEFFPESCHTSNKALFKWHNLHLFRALSIAISTFKFKRIFSNSYKLREYW